MTKTMARSLRQYANVRHKGNVGAALAEKIHLITKTMQGYLRQCAKSWFVSFEEALEWYVKRLLK